MPHDQHPEVEQFLYRAVASSKRHRHRVSTYLVERYEDSAVVARIESLGLVHERLVDHELVLRGLRRNLVAVGSWQPTASRHHARVRVEWVAPRQ